jgi:hypothetical protein
LGGRAYRPLSGIVVDPTGRLKQTLVESLVLPASSRVIASAADRFGNIHVVTQRSSDEIIVAVIPIYNIGTRKVRVYAWRNQELIQFGGTMQVPTQMTVRSIAADPVSGASLIAFSSVSGTSGIVKLANGSDNPQPSLSVDDVNPRPVPVNNLGFLFFTVILVGAFVAQRYYLRRKRLFFRVNLRSF